VPPAGRSQRRGRVARSAALAAASAALGPHLDAYHTAFGALVYAHPVHVPLLGVATAPWTPALFALAGPAIGLPALALDAAFPPPAPRPRPPRTCAAVAAFAALYYLSGALDAAGAPARGPLLCAAAAAEWAALDRSVGGGVMGLAAAAAGWVVEAAIVNGTGEYAYARPEFMGLPLWIAPVYFAGGPAVASVARSLAAAFQRGDGG
jgi:hypothetical protein